jgi:hypothetical protein
MFIITQFSIGQSIYNQYSTNASKFTLDSINYQSLQPDPNNPSDAFRSSYTYDANGNMIEMKSYMWSGFDNKWIPIKKIEYSFDSYGNNDSYTRSNWSPSNVWQGSYKMDKTYNTNGELIETIDSVLNQLSSQWEAQWKTSYIYGTNGNLNSSLTMFWNLVDNQWGKWEKSENTYDSNNNLSESYFSSWKPGNLTWDTLRVIKNNYDSNNNLTNSKTSVKDNNQGNWSIEVLETFTYNQNYQVINYEKNHYVIPQKSHKYEYTYDLNDNPIEIKRLLWDTVDISWVNSYKDILSYDNSHDSSVLIVPQEFKSNNLMITCF